MRVLIDISCMFVVAACTAHGYGQRFTGTLPNNTYLDMAGKFSLSPEGELRLALETPCNHIDSIPRAERDCDRVALDAIAVIAHTPWKRDIRGTWSDASHIVFNVDWKATGVDPLSEDAPDVVARPWVISGAQWTPSSLDAAMILKQIGDATDTETAVVSGGPPSNLEVTTFEIDGGALQTGATSTLVVRLANRGSGTAYRVVATTRSSVEALHGRRMSFGSIKPGADKVRKLTLTVPPSEPGPDTMLVLALSESNGVAPHNFSRRIPIARSDAALKLANAAPKLSMHCVIFGHDVPRPDLDAGKNLTLRCAVNNTGDAEAKQVTVEASIAGGVPARSATLAIPAGGHATFDASTMVPRELPIDAAVEIAITAKDRTSSRSAQTTVTGVVRKPKLCVAGQLTRTQYRAKVIDLRAAVAAGELTQAQFDHYDTELVSCLK